eukprot:3798415-Rhodomonas_salina.2
MDVNPRFPDAAGERATRMETARLVRIPLVRALDSFFFQSGDTRRLASLHQCSPTPALSSYRRTPDVER